MRVRLSKDQGKSRSGFTLMEILIVVVIIAILASLILPKLLVHQDLEIAEPIAMISGMRKAVLAYYDMHDNDDNPNLAFTMASHCNRSAPYDEWTLASGTGAIEIVRETFGIELPPCNGRNKWAYEVQIDFDIAERNPPYIVAIHAFRTNYECSDVTSCIWHATIITWDEFGTVTTGSKPGWNLHSGAKAKEIVPRYLKDVAFI